MMRRIVFSVGPMGLIVLASMMVIPFAFADQPSKRPSDEVLGKTLYERHCFSCHGPNGQGDGPAVEALLFKVPKLEPVEADDKTVELVQTGRGTMPSFAASLDKHDTRRILRHMKFEAPVEKTP